MLLPALPVRLTLRQAEDYALAHQPLLAASQLRRQAETRTRVRGTLAILPANPGRGRRWSKARDDNSRMAAMPGITNPTILTRQSDGGLISQLITDFGRTYFLTTSARSSALSAAERTEFARQRSALPRGSSLLFRTRRAGSARSRQSDRFDQ